MLREKQMNFTRIFSLIDVLITLMALLLSFYWLTGKPLSTSNREYMVMFLIYVPVWYMMTHTFSVHKIQVVRSDIEQLFDYLKAALTCGAAVYIALNLFKLDIVREDVFFRFIALNFIMLYTFKVLINKLLTRTGSHHRNTRNVMVVADENSDYVIDKLLTTPGTGFIIKAIVTDSPVLIKKYSERFTIISNHSEIRNYLIENPIHELHYCNEDFKTNELRDLVYNCQEVGVIFRMKLILYNQLSNNSTIGYLAEIPFITVSNLPNNYLQLRIKRLMDVIVSLFAILLSLPFMLIIAILIKLNSKGPVFYSQIRSGLRGRKFKLYKFRTMVVNSDELREKLEELNEMDGPVFKIKNDPRITLIGKFLRKTSIDEFPQFLNVFIGDMSVVGPRPPIPTEVVQYEPWQLRRISVKPGITCIWQVSGRNETSFEEWMRMDLEYIDNWSLKLDLVLCFKTVGTVLSMNGS